MIERVLLRRVDDEPAYALTVGDEVRLDGRPVTILAVASDRLRVVDERGDAIEVEPARLDIPRRFRVAS